MVSSRSHSVDRLFALYVRAVICRPSRLGESKVTAAPELGLGHQESYGLRFFLMANHILKAATMTATITSPITPTTGIVASCAVDVIAETTFTFCYFAALV